MVITIFSFLSGIYTASFCYFWFRVFQEGIGQFWKACKAEVFSIHSNQGLPLWIGALTCGIIMVVFPLHFCSRIVYCSIHKNDPSHDHSGCSRFAWGFTFAFILWFAICFIYK